MKLLWFINTKEEKEEFINIINTDNIEKNNPKNIFTIIFDDYKNYPNFNHIKTISNLEKYFIFYYSDYNELNLKYKFEEEDIKDNSIELFGEIFVNNNKENCFLIINENIFDLCRFIHLYEIFDNQDNIDKPLQLDVKLIEPKNNLIIDASFMFNGISTLQSNSNFLHFNSKNITKMSYMFYNCSSIIELPDISNLDTSNVTDMSYMFYNCSSLIKLPDISIWNTEKVTDISNMFYNCESLLSLPDISKWDINDTKMDNLFKNCKSLSYLPDLSKWNIDEETVDSGMLVGCKALEVNIIKKGKYNIKFLNCLNSCFKTIKFCTFFILIIFLLILFFLPIGEIISLFKLNKTISFIENPLEYLNIKDNISFIYTNSTRKSIIKISKDENQFINYYLNFTFINNNITFDNDIKYLKINNIIYAIFFYLFSKYSIWYYFTNKYYFKL